MNGYHIDDELLAKYLLGEADAPEQEAVAKWISSNPSNKRYFEHFKLIWETSKKLELPSTITADDAWERFRNRVQQAPRQAAPVKLTPRSTWMNVAAITVFTVSIAILIYFVNSRSTEPVTVVANLNPVHDTLPDGSIVTLNKQSTISYAGSFKGERKIQLRGEAFFNVVADKTRPFVITVNDVTVTVVGTSFNVKDVDGKTQVLVETGTVRVTRNNKTVELRAKEQLLADPRQTKFQKEIVTDRLHEYYRSKQFVCDNTPLWKVAEVLNEAYHVNIVIATPGLRKLPLTTTFNNESLDKILSIIAETFQISVKKQGDQIILQ